MINKSKSIVFEKPGVIRLLDAERPKVGDNNVLIKVAACGLCGTDQHIFNGHFPASFPVTPGHEFAGQVEEIGSKVKYISVGDFVSVNPNIWCGHCDPCREGTPHLCTNLVALGVNLNGGLAPFCIAPEDSVYTMSPDTDPVKACLAEPISCVLHGVDRLEIKAGSRAIVFGGGFIGQLMLQALRLQGASEVVLVEPLEGKRKVAEKLGFKTIDPFNGLSKQHTQNYFDVAVDCAGVGDVLEKCVESTKNGGSILIFAAYPDQKKIPIGPYSIFRKELKLIGSFTYPDTQIRAIRMIEANLFDLDEIITKIDIDDASVILKTQQNDDIIKAVVTM